MEKEREREREPLPAPEGARRADSGTIPVPIVTSHNSL
jgi:hypothetical protein